MVLCCDVASITVNQLDRCNLLRRSIVCYGTGKTSDWTVLRMFCLSTFCPVQIFVPAVPELRSQNDDDRHRANGARQRSAHVRMR